MKNYNDFHPVKVGCWKGLQVACRRYKIQSVKMESMAELSELIDTLVNFNSIIYTRRNLPASYSLDFRNWALWYSTGKNTYFFNRHILLNQALAYSSDTVNLSQITLPVHFLYMDISDGGHTYNGKELYGIYVEIASTAAERYLKIYLVASKIPTKNSLYGVYDLRINFSGEHDLIADAYSTAMQSQYYIFQDKSELKKALDIAVGCIMCLCGPAPMIVQYETVK